MRPQHWHSSNAQTSAQGSFAHLEECAEIFDVLGVMPMAKNDRAVGSRSRFALNCAKACVHFIRVPAALTSERTRFPLEL